MSTTSKRNTRGGQSRWSQPGPQTDVLVMDPPAEQLAARRRVWQDKYAIRACYQGWYERMRPFVVPGQSLEVGAGSGDFRSLWPGLITSDIIPVPWLDFAADAMRLPLPDGCLGNVLVIDLLHHLSDPHRFFKEASRVLRPGGRILAIEPYITPVSFLVYRLFHHEDIWFGGYQKTRTGQVEAVRDKEDPWQGNLALPNLVLSQQRQAWPRHQPDLRIVRAQKFGLLDFQLAGGFKPYTFVRQPRMYDFLLRVDRGVDWLAWLWGFRIFVVIEKT